MWETQVWSLGWEDPLEKGMATHSSIPIWRILWTEEPGGLQSMVSQRVGYNWVTNAFTFFSIRTYAITCKQVKIKRGRWEGGLGWGIHVNPWLIHVNVWQKPLQYCKVISLQLINDNNNNKVGTSLIVQWLRIHASTKSCPTLWPHGLQYFRPPCPSPSPRVCPFRSLIRELRCCMPHGMAKIKKKNKQ